MNFAWREESCLNITKQSPAILPPSHSPNPSHVPDSRFPPATNPQFTKWIMEHSVFYNAEKGIGSEVDFQSSMSSLTNIPERDRPGPGSPVPSYTTSSTHPRRDEFADRGYYRPSSGRHAQTLPVMELENSSLKPQFHSMP